MASQFGAVVRPAEGAQVLIKIEIVARAARLDIAYVSKEDQNILITIALPACCGVLCRGL
jgi:hypothetical protein